MEEDKAKVVHRQEFAKISSRRIGTDAFYFIAIINFINDAKKKGEMGGKNMYMTPCGGQPSESQV